MDIVKNYEAIKFNKYAHKIKAQKEKWELEAFNRDMKVRDIYHYSTRIANILFDNKYFLGLDINWDSPITSIEGISLAKLSMCKNAGAKTLRYLQELYTHLNMKWTS